MAMKFLKWLLAGVGVLAAVLLAGGLLLPSAFTVERSARIAAPPEKVYPLLADLKRWRDWAAWYRRDAAMQITYSGAESGTGAVSAWKSASQGDGRMTITAAEAPRRVAFELYFPDWDSTSHAEITLAPQDGATLVRWTMQGDMGRNPLWHWMVPLMDRMVGKDFDEGLAALKTLAEGPAGR